MEVKLVLRYLIKMSFNLVSFLQSISQFSKSLKSIATLCLEPHTLHLIEVVSCPDSFLK